MVPSNATVWRDKTSKMASCWVIIVLISGWWKGGFCIGSADAFYLKVLIALTGIETLLVDGLSRACWYIFIAHFWQDCKLEICPEWKILSQNLTINAQGSWEWEPFSEPNLALCSSCAALCFGEWGKTLQESRTGKLMYLANVILR